MDTSVLPNLSANPIKDKGDYVVITVSRSAIGSQRNRSDVELLVLKSDLGLSLRANNIAAPGEPTISNAATSLIARSDHGKTYVAWSYPNSDGKTSERNLWCALRRKRALPDELKQSDTSQPVDYRFIPDEEKVGKARRVKPLDKAARSAAIRKARGHLFQAMLDDDDDKIAKQQERLRHLGIQ